MTLNNEPAASNGAPRNEVPGRRSRGWIWFYLILGVLAIAAVAVLWVYNVKQQLTPEQLAAARKLWEAKRPRNYDLTWTKEGSASGTFVVIVRGGEVQSVTMKQDVVEKGEAKTRTTPLPERLYRRHDMEGLFEDLQGFLKIKEEPKNRNRIFLHATFDPEDGHLEGYIYSNPENRQRIKVIVQRLDRK
jgi:hypothetical protein